MKLTRKERDFLTTFLAIAQKMLGSSSKVNGRNGITQRHRRTAPAVALLKKQIRAARRENVPVKSIADEFGVTPAYIYQLGK